MTEWIAAAPLELVRRKKKLVVRVGEDDVVVFTNGDAVHAMADICVHKQKRLSKGLVFQDKMICPGHQWAFCVKTGWEDQWAMCQPVYDTRINDEGVVEVFGTPRTVDSKPAD